MPLPPVEHLDFDVAWAAWWGGRSIQDAVVCGVYMRWVGRAGAVLQGVGVLALAIEVVGHDRFARWRDRFAARPSLATTWAAWKERAAWCRSTAFGRHPERTILPRLVDYQGTDSALRRAAMVIKTGQLTAGCLSCLGTLFLGLVVGMGIVEVGLALGFAGGHWPLGGPVGTFACLVIAGLAAWLLLTRMAARASRFSSRGTELALVLAYWGVETVRAIIAGVGWSIGGALARTAALLASRNSVNGVVLSALVIGSLIALIVA